MRINFITWEMFRVSRLSAILFSLLFLSFSSKAETPISLSFFFEHNDGYQWTWFASSTLSTHKIHSFEQKPSAIYWERKGEAIRVINKAEIISFSRSGILLNDPPLPLPEMISSEKPVALWRDASDQNLCLATWVSVKPDQVQYNIIISKEISVQTLSEPS